MTAVPRDSLLDVSRLIWRLWSGRLPTGIDRVCLEYVRHYAARSLAVVQFRGKVIVLGAADSDRLFTLLTGGEPGIRLRLLTLGARALLAARRSPPRRSMVYLNVGHTGLDQPALRRWIEANEVKALYLVHDLIPITHPQFCRSGEAARHSLRMENALITGSGIIGNSQATLDELQAFASKRDLPSPPAIAAWISGYAPPRGIAAKMVERPHFVTVGTIEGRKNHLLLLRVWRQLLATLGRDPPMLLVIGQRGWEAEEVISILDGSDDLKDHVHELGRCDDAEVAAWTMGARALLMPSLVEGFGLPLVEALQLGTPVIASDLPVYREVVGDIPTYLDPLDLGSWARVVADFTTDGPERLRQIREMQGFSPPQWAEHFAKIDNWLMRFQREARQAREPGGG